MAQDGTPRESGVFLIAGGPGSDPAETAGLLRKAFVAYGLERPNVAYIGTASDDDERFFSFFVSFFEQSGAGSVELVRLASDDADVESAKEKLAAADVVFVSGGQPAEGMRWIDAHGLAPWLRDLYRGGKPFVGLSAGAIMLGTHWFVPEKPDARHPGSLVDCLGIVPAVFDAHGEGEDWEDLRCLLALMGPGSSGFGLASGSMMRGFGTGAIETVAGTPVRLENNYSSR